MSKFVPLAAWLIASLAAPVPAARAAVLGPYAADCVAGGKPAMLVEVRGLKSRSGIVRVQSYGGDPANYFDKGTYLERVEVRPPSAGQVEICVPVPHAGIYAVSIRHDANGNGSVDIGSDGGGFSGNPSISLFDAMFRRKPSPVQVQVRVNGLTIVPIVLNYVHGGRVAPIAGGQQG
ncbi:MAG TPA: DUF2141 domain-containing protein [Sphingomonas sp.]|nr:DUF2141 domain-containing protein [Sphingomonas sp.]